MRRFLEELRRRGPSSRADLTRAIGVTAPTSSSVIADLLAAGFLEEVSVASTARGRPGKLFRLATEKAYVVGATIDVGTCEVGTAGLDGQPHPAPPRAFATPQSYDALIDALAKNIAFLQDRNAGRCHGVGLAVPGLVDERHGKVALSPNLHFLDGQRIARDLADRLGCEVVATQEEHALCLCEQHVGHATGLSNFAVIDFSSGVGMGVVAGDRYISGANGFAGEIGHITVVPDGVVCGCGNRGCLETVASDTALLRTLSEREGRHVSLHDLSSLPIEEELDRALAFVAIGIATVVNLFNPSAVFVHGKLFTLAPTALERVREQARSRALRPSVDVVKLELAVGNKMQGAVIGLLNHLFESVGPTLS